MSHVVGFPEMGEGTKAHAVGPEVVARGARYAYALCGTRVRVAVHVRWGQVPYDEDARQCQRCARSLTVAEATDRARRDDHDADPSPVASVALAVSMAVGLTYEHRELVSGHRCLTRLISEASGALDVISGAGMLTNPTERLEAHLRAIEAQLEAILDKEGDGA